MNKIFASIPPVRLLIYGIIFLFLPHIYVGYHYMKQKKEWGAVFEKMIEIDQIYEEKTRKQATNTLARTLFTGSHPSYLAEQLEHLPFLNKEKAALEHLRQNPLFAGNEVAEMRYRFLQNGENALSFSEENVQNEAGISETNVVLVHPVEIDTNDLKEILDRIEGTAPFRPLFLITDFKIDKKSESWGNEVYELDLKLLKREFFQ